MIQVYNTQQNLKCRRIRLRNLISNEKCRTTASDSTATRMHKRIFGERNPAADIGEDELLHKVNFHACTHTPLFPNAKTDKPHTPAHAHRVASQGGISGASFPLCKLTRSRLTA